MTIAEAEHFYKQDKHLYELNKNKEFLNWLKEQIENGYHCYIEIKELQDLINKLTYWYEMKYPDRELDYYNGIIDEEFENIEKMSKVMSLKQLLLRLTDRQMSIINCHYRSSGFRQYPIYENGQLIRWKSEIVLTILNKAKDDEFWSDELPRFSVGADPKTGIATCPEELIKFTEKENLYINELYEILNNYEEELDTTELQECLYDNSCDLTLRYKLLQLVALSILYSKNTIPEYGYERAKRFINEFNKKMNLELSTEEIDEIISRDYRSENTNNNVVTKRKTRSLIRFLTCRKEVQ